MLMSVSGTQTWRLYKMHPSGRQSLRWTVTTATRPPHRCWRITDWWTDGRGSVRKPLSYWLAANQANQDELITEIL